MTLRFDPEGIERFKTKIRGIPGYPTGEDLPIRDMVFESGALWRLADLLLVAGMKAGQPLNDHDMQDWLITINELAKARSKQNGAIIACSALKEKYRIILASDIPVPVDWVWLNGSYELILQRMQNRKGHFMPESLLRSQFETLEPPVDAQVVDINNSPENIVAQIRAGLLL